MVHSRKTLTRLDLTHGGQKCFLLTTLLDEGKEGFKLTVCNGETAWSGEVTEDELDDHRVKMKMDFNTFVRQTAQAFTGEKEGDIVFQFQLKTKKDNSTEFMWKKHIPAEDITFQLGSTILHQDKNVSSTLCLILDHCIENTTRLNSRIRSLEMDNERLSQERSNALKRLEKCVVAKEDLEKDLYTKFVTILNSKKDKIRELKEQLANGVIRNSEESSPKSGTSQQSSSQSKHKKTNKRQYNSGSDGEGGKLTPSDDDTTDDETKPTQSKRGRTKVVNPADDDSLVLEEEEEESGKNGKVVKRPQRQRGGNKKQTPSKPVLPKVPSGEANTGSISSAKRSSVRKTASTTSSRSSVNIDADDLIDDI